METLIKALDMKKTVAFLDTYGQKISKNTTMWEFQTVLKENFGESGLRKNNEETFLEFAKYYLELYQKPAPDQDSSTSLKDQYLIYILNVVRTGVDPNERIRK